MSYLISQDPRVNLFDAVNAARDDVRIVGRLKGAFADLISKTLWEAGIDQNKLRGLRIRRDLAIDPRDAAALRDEIAEVEARIATLPQHLPLDTREDIAMWEGQLRLAERGYDDKQIAGIKSRIASLMTPPTLADIAAAGARVDAAIAEAGKPLVLA